MNNVFDLWFSRPLRWINFEWGKVVEMLARRQRMVFLV